jgi:hypothetical protein
MKGARGKASAKASAKASKTTAATTTTTTTLPVVHADDVAAANDRLPIPSPFVDLDDHQTQATLQTLKGPTAWTNWIVQERILVGAYPRKRELVRQILAVGVTTYVCLMPADELSRLEPYGSYFKLLPDMLRQMHEQSKLQHINATQLEYVHVPMYDLATTNDQAVRDLIDLLVVRFHQNRNIFIHCRYVTHAIVSDKL